MIRAPMNSSLAMMSANAGVADLMATVAVM